MKRFVALTVVVTHMASLTLAQDTALRVSVNATGEQTVLIDHGRNSGLVQGLRVRLFPPEGAEFEGVIRSVGPDDAQVDIPAGIEPPPVGTSGEVLVTLPDGAPQPGAPGNVPEHPPWTRRLELLGPEVPLLAPVKRERAEDRPREIDGRTFLQFDYTWDRGNDRKSEFYVGRTGVTLKATNLFHLGGQLKFSGQATLRGQRIEDVDDDDDDSETRLRLDRLSYEIGGHDYSSYRAEIGRFYSYYVPELGLIDGIEGALLFRSGLRVGGGMGAFPLPFPRRQTGDDLGFYAFANYQSKADHLLSATLAYQKTWHKGEADRDLIIGRINVRPTPKLWLSGSFKADVYSSSDTIKTESVGLTSFYLQARYTPTPKAGLALSLSHYSWPELLREEFRNLPEELVRDGRVDRAELSAWYKLFKDFRLTGRVNYWNDQDDDGGGGQLGFDWTNAFVDGLSLHSSVRFTQGAFNEGVGYRALIRKNFRDVSIFTEYDAFQYKAEQFEGEETEFLRQSVRGGVDWHHRKWYVNLNANYYFGEDDDSLGLGFFTEYRF